MAKAPAVCRSSQEKNTCIHPHRRGSYHNLEIQLCITLHYTKYASEIEADTRPVPPGLITYSLYGLSRQWCSVDYCASYKIPPRHGSYHTTATNSCSRRYSFPSDCVSIPSKHPPPICAREYIVHVLSWVRWSVW